jgi:leucyl-tRNA synthetase
MNEYDPKSIEKKWQEEWEKQGHYPGEDSSLKPKWYSLMEFPYPSGDGLHTGHVRGYTAMDVVSRKRRMQGYNVMFPIGWDAFGLPTENYALKTGRPPREITKENTENFRTQFKRLGMSFAWSREVNTTDPKYYKWTQWIFLKLLEHGLAYKARIPINWCPKDKIGLANEEVVDGCCERCGTPVEQKEKEQWMLAITKYADRLEKDLDDVDYPERVKTQQRNWIGKSEGALIKFDDIEVFTTRPDTIFGATFIAVAGKENKFTGRYVTNPATKEPIPVWEADYVFADYGTGAIMGVPAHDERDFEFAKKHNLPIKQVVMQSLVDLANPPLEGKENTFRRMVLVVLYNPKINKYLTLKWKQLPWTSFVTGGIEEGEDPEESGKRELEEETGYTNVRMVRHLGRREAFFYAAHKDVNRHVHAEHFLFELVDETQVPIDESEKDTHEAQWLSLEELKQVKLQHVEGPSIIQKLETGIDAYSGEGVLINSGSFDGLKTEEALKKMAETFGELKTTYKLRDWVFSRQRYWGEPIPVVHCKSCGIVPLPESALPLTLPEVENYQPTETGESPLANISEWVNTTCPKCQGAAKRETDVMPNWAGSSWYFLRYCDPFNDKELASKDKLEYWMQVDWYNGGMEHTVLHLLYSRFWNKFLFDIGVVPTSEPYKKRTSHGLILAEGGEKMSKSKGNVVNPDAIVDRFGADSLRLYEMFMGPFEQAIAWSESSIVGPRRFLEKVWKLKEKISSEKTDIHDESLMHQTIKKVSEDIETLGFNTAVSTLMVFANSLDKQETISQEEYEILLRLLAPFAPHMTEELWNTLGSRPSIHVEAWPTFDPQKLQSKEVTIAVQVNGKVRGTFVASPEIGESEAVAQAQSLPEIMKWVGDKTPVRVVYVPGKLVNIVIS